MTADRRFSGAALARDGLPREVDPPRDEAGGGPER